MQSLYEIDLADLTIGGEEFSADPDRYMLQAKAKHMWLAKSEFGFVVTDADAVSDLLGKDTQLGFSADNLVAIMGAEGTEWGRFQLSHLLGKSGDEHQRLRSSVSKAFMPRSVKTYTDRIHQVVSRLLDEWSQKGQFDFAEFASNFPVAVMFGLFGADPARIQDLKDALEASSESLSLDRSIFPKLEWGFEVLFEFVDQLISERIKAGNSGEPDLLDAVILAQTEGSLAPQETRDLLIFLLIAGYDTSKGQLTQIVNILLDRPDLWDRCASDREFCNKVVSEAFRHSGVGTTYRNVLEDISYRDVLLPVGALLIFPLSIVCRYSSSVDHALDFDPDRTDGKANVIFGRGPHMCLGQFLAKLQIGEGLHLIARRLANPRRAGPAEWRLYPGTWGPRKLPMAFDIAPVMAPA